MAKYLYNGRELPALPEWDKETYPYVCLADGYGIGEDENGDVAYVYSGFVHLCCFDQPIDFVDKIGDKYGHINALINTQWFMLVDGEWVDKGKTSVGSCLVFWANSDVYFSTDEDEGLGDLAGTLYLAASDPIPVPPIPSDAYIVKGGKLYKVKGGSAQSILTFDSVDEMNAASAPDGTIALVPSEGASGAKAIDLSNYAFSDGYTINDRIMSLLSTGGGTYTTNTTVTDNEKFWVDLATNQELMFVVDLSAIAQGARIVVPTVCVTRVDGVAFTATSSIIAYLPENGGVLSIVIVINRAQTSTGVRLTEIRMAVEPVTIPTT